ncbi:hypothetical protein [Methylocystis sp. Sn-Cys]|uniref:hypothetical protein n=1 Tax=Methylocystis sp. Sn-Cys TaxID=1701263 RepID=UPI001921BF6E|nr:hypothetical protein [Methylocystis sp. Sn-Cys]MBL1255712.1 hypothetical protein [Methylocystis sp. Sn-Cys]
MLNDRRQRFAGFALLLPLLSSPALAGSVASSNWMVPNKDVALHCAPLPYEIHCSISRLANPEYSSHCFYVGPDGSSYPMKRDYRFGFYNGIVSIKVHDGPRISGQLTEERTGRRAVCSE